MKLLSDFIENGRTGTRISLPGDIQASMDYGVISIFRKTATQSDRGDEFGAMENELYSMRSRMNKLMRQVHSSSEQMAAASEELTASSNQAAQASTI